VFPNSSIKYFVNNTDYLLSRHNLGILAIYSVDSLEYAKFIKNKEIIKKKAKRPTKSA